MSTDPVPAASAFAAWTARLGPLTGAHRDLATDALVDTLACLVAGARDPVTQAVVGSLGSTAADGPSLCADGLRRPPAVAAAVNGTAAHVLDFDDNFTPGMSHASAVLVPALLAVVDAEPGLAERLLPAYAVGLQAQAFVGALVGYQHYVAGWHATSTVGCIGTAAAVAFLRADDPDLVARAMTVAASSAAGVKAQFGTPMKALHAGLAARNAVEAVELAAHGVGGDPAVLERADGFAGLYAAGGTPGDASRWLGERLAIDQPGVLTKRFPSCGSTHLVLDGIEDLRRETGFGPEDVRAVEAVVGPANLGSLPHRRPVDGLQARFSMDYCVEVFVTRGALGLADFADARVAELLAAPRPFEVTTRAWTEEERPTAGGEPAHPPHRVRVTLSDGTTLSRTRALPRGSVEEPFSRAERRRKFLDCCGPDASPLYERLTSWPQRPDPAAVAELLTGGRDRH